MIEFTIRVVKQSTKRHVYFQRIADAATLVRAFASQVHHIRDLAQLPRVEIDAETWARLASVVNVGGSLSYDVPDACIIVEARHA